MAPDWQKTKGTYRSRIPNRRSLESRWKGPYREETRSSLCVSVSSLRTSSRGGSAPQFRSTWANREPTLSEYLSSWLKAERQNNFGISLSDWGQLKPDTPPRGILSFTIKTRRRKEEGPQGARVQTERRAELEPASSVGCPPQPLPQHENQRSVNPPRSTGSSLQAFLLIELNIGGTILSQFVAGCETKTRDKYPGQSRQPSHLCSSLGAYVKYLLSFHVSFLQIQLTLIGLILR